MRRFLILILFVSTTTASAADLPWSRGKGGQVVLTIQHEAEVKAQLQQVAFAEPQGQCADLLTDSLVAEFASNGATVIDRANLKRIMSEHKLNFGGAIDEKTTAKIGKLLGAGSLIFVKVHECGTYQTKESKNSVDGLGVSRTLVPTTHGTLKASIQIVNLTTGVTYVARVIDSKVALRADAGSDSAASRATEAAVSFLRGAHKYDEFPPVEEVHSALFADSVGQVHRMLFPWTETRTFIFFDDNECSLHVAFGLLQNGDYEGAAREAQTSLDTCKSTSKKPSILAHAYYNRGMTYYMLADFDAALAAISQAARLDANKVFTDGMTEVTRARTASLLKGDKKVPPAPPAKTALGSAKPEPAMSTEERLRQLENLHKKSLISDEEYTRKRKEILAGL